MLGILRAATLALGRIFTSLAWWWISGLFRGWISRLRLGLVLLLLGLGIALGLLLGLGIALLRLGLGIALWLGRVAML